MEVHPPLEVVFIMGFHKIWVDPLSLSFKFGEDPTSGC